MSPIFAVLALCAFAIGAAALVGLILGKFGQGRPAPIVPLGIASAIAVTAMAGSLFYSEVANFEPCEFCWYQRIAMYPLAVILPLALVRRDYRIWPYGLTIATIGLGSSCYHYYLQHWFHGTTTCAVTNPCTAIWVEQFGFITIPFMAGCGFFATSLLMLVLRRSAGSGPALQPDG